MKLNLWVIRVVERWDDRGNYPKDEGHLLEGRVWLSKAACQDCADAWNVASDHNFYKAESIKLTLIDWEYVKYQIPKKIRYWLQETWRKIKMKFQR